MLNNLIKVKGGGRGVIISGGDEEARGRGGETLIQPHSGLRTRRRAVRRHHLGGRGGMEAAGGKPSITAASRRRRAGFAEG